MPSGARNGLFTASLAVAAMLILLQSCLKSTGPKLPEEVVKVIQQTGVNRIELTKTIARYYPDDSIRLTAAYFIIGNIYRQYSVEYELVDSNGNQIPFQPTDLVDSIPLKESWELFSKKHSHAKFKALNFSMDRDTLTASYLANNIDLAVESRGYWWSSDIPDDDFYENVLPYRVSNEIPDDWRQYLADFILPQIPDSIRYSRNRVAFLVNQNIHHRIVTDGRFSKQTRLSSPKEILERGRGSQEEISHLKVKILRSIGIPAAIDYIPYAGKSGSTWYFPVFLNEEKKYQPLLQSGEDSTFPTSVHISKVYRRCFSNPMTGLFAQKHSQQSSPPFLGHYPQLDVTRYYVPIDSIIFRGHCNDSIMYLAVWDGETWKAVDWARVGDGKAVFNDIGPIAHYRFAVMKADSLVLLPEYAPPDGCEKSLNPHSNDGRKKPFHTQQSTGFQFFDQKQ